MTYGVAFASVAAWQFDVVGRVDWQQTAAHGITQRPVEGRVNAAHSCPRERPKVAAAVAFAIRPTILKQQGIEGAELLACQPLKRHGAELRRDNVLPHVRSVALERRFA